MSMAAMEQFWEDLDSGEVHIRDRWQFALKSEFFPQPEFPTHRYVQEFYLFIPESLQINNNTYLKGQFYLDETNLIRYKTPEFTFTQLFNHLDRKSPLTQIMNFCELPETPENRKKLSDELKLLANVVRSTLRREVRKLIDVLNETTSSKTLLKEFEIHVKQLCLDIRRLRELYSKAQHKFLSTWNDPLFYRQLIYIDEFIGDAISHYLAGLLESIRLKSLKDFADIDQELCEILLIEQRIPESEMNHGKHETIEAESICYRAGMLNKFVMDVLHLSTNRFSLDQQYQHWIGAISAGIAMLLYIALFFWLGNVFVINSLPFLLLTVIIYILKDRIKEWLRVLSYQKFSQLFPDYTTIIKSPDNKTNLGILKESVSFIEEPLMPKDLRDIRNAEFHTVLETYQRPETVLFYKRIIEINTPQQNTPENHRFGLNIIFRFNIHRFLRKAADPSETRLILDPKTKKLVSIRLPKVYHLNMIIRSTSFQQDQPPKVELKKLRIVIDKNGIKRIEHFKSHPV